MRTALMALALCPLLVLTDRGRPADGEIADESMALTRWPYKTADGRGCFVMLGREWLEVVGGKLRFSFRETRRTATYVEPYDGSRDMWVRLSGSSATWCRSDRAWVSLPVTPAEGNASLETRLDGT